jgi:hypothetical protein
MSAQLIENDIARMESGIRQLKVQYDMFFAGALDREPKELRQEIERIIKRHTHVPMNKYAHRFHFNAVVARYNTFSELWNKMVRTNEGGATRRATTASTEPLRERLLARCRVTESTAEDTALRRLHSRYVDERRRQGIETPVAFDSFARGIDNQVRRLRREAGCEGVELRVIVRDDKVQLTARPTR